MGNNREVYDKRTTTNKVKNPERIYDFAKDSPKYLGQVHARFRQSLQKIDLDPRNFSKMYNYYPLLHDLWVQIASVQSHFRSLYKNETDIPKDLVNLYEHDLTIMHEYIKQWHPQRLHHCSNCDNGTKKSNKTFCPYCFRGRSGGTLREYILSRDPN